jgi:hypothetical protein
VLGAAFTVHSGGIKMGESDIQSGSKKCFAIALPNEVMERRGAESKA